MENRVNLYDVILSVAQIKNYANVELASVTGDCMKSAGIEDGGTVVIDTGIKHETGHVVCVEVFGECMVKRFIQDETGTYLQMEYPTVKRLSLLNENYKVRGVVVSTINPVRRYVDSIIF